MKRAAVIIAMFVLVAPLGALPEPTPDELLANRRRFEQLRKQPELMQKLRTEADAFFGLELERKRQIARFEKALRQEPEPVQSHLIAVLDRYVDWFQHLDDVTREKINLVREPQQRLELIRKLREDQWIADQPKALRETIAKLEGEARKKLIAKEKAEERQRRLEWTVAKNFWAELEGEAKGRRFPLPAKLADLQAPVQFYVREYLQRMFLAPEEIDQLAKLEGQWPQYPMKLVELADKHPAALPGPHGPKSIAELPPRLFNELRFKLPNPKKLDKLPAAVQPVQLAKYLGIKEGKWPEFGAELARVAHQHGMKYEFELFAYKPDCLSPLMQEYVTTKLKPVLDGKESLRLAEAIGKWPDFPQAIQELAKRHHQRPPWFTLPPGERWDGYRVAK